MSASKVVSFQSGVESRVRQRKLLESCRDLTLRQMQAMLQRMLDTADDALFAMADKAETNAEQTLYFDSMRIVRLHRQDIERRFRQRLQENFDRFRDGDTEAEPPTVELSLENLSLVEEHDLEESLAITNLVMKIRNQYGQAIHAIEQRLGAIAPERRIDDDTNPLGPKAICQAFSEATRDLETELKIKLIIYKLFDRQLCQDIGALFDSINDAFIDAGVLPTIKASIRRTPAAGPATSPLADTDVAALADEAGPDGDLLATLHQLLARQRGAMAPGMGTLAAGTTAPAAPLATPDALAALTALQQQPAALPGGGELPPGEAIRLAMGSQLGVGEGQPVALQGADNDMIDVVAMMFEYILDDPNLPDAARALIGRLQIPMIKVAILDKGFLASRGHPARKLLNALAEAGLGLDDEPADDNRLLAVMSGIVDRVLEDFTDDMTLFSEQLAELEAFLARRRAEEEARQAETRREREMREQQELARTWVRETLKEALAGKELPKEVLKIIMGPWHAVMTHTYLEQGEDSALWKNQRRFIDVLVWSVQPKQLKVDRERLGGIIRHLTASLREGLQSIDYPPEKIERIFAALEPYHHASLYGLRVAGEAPPPAPVEPDQSGFFLFDTPEDRPADTTEEVDHEAETLPDMARTEVESAIAAMEDQMATLEQLEAILDEPLASDAVAEAEDEELDEFDREIIEDIVLAGWDARDHDLPEDYPDDEYLEMARHLEAGKWVEFTDDDGNRVRAKLAWKSELLGEYTFTNWKFDVVADKTLQGFAADLRRGTARIIDEAPVLDRALSAVMKGLTRKSA